VVDQPCIWGPVYERAVASGRVDDLRVYIQLHDRSLQGTSSWINDVRSATAARADNTRRTSDSGD
jgi:hypothetical protein